ncbi:MAG: ABC transporter substrate-binding protein [Proteobacteria bacterium]|nr:MAG: ABC transporter substrate-binding protein [Pseudomonadota bacterium]QKK12310.1 MAG: TRAP transporter substrate-binding protein [Pseudomonadota bacterium]
MTNTTLDPKRRKLLKGGAIAAAGAAMAGFSAPAISKSRTKWTMVSTWPRNLPGLGTGAQYFADMVTQVSGGDFTIELHPSGEIVPAFESIDAVGSGTVEIGHGAPYYWKGKAPATQFLSNMPFGLTAQEYNAWYYFGGGMELADKVYRDQLGCKFVLCGNTGVQHPGWSTKEVKSLADFKGLKMRMPGIAAEAMKQLGAVVVNVPGSEVTAALASGTVDWVEWNNPHGEASMAFYRFAKYYYTPGFHESGTALELFINSKAWDGLSKENQALIEQCAAATNVRMLSEFVWYSGPQFQEFISKHGTQERVIDDESLVAIGNEIGKVIETIISSDKYSREVYASLMKARELQMPYSNNTEVEFMRARALPYVFPKV